MENPDLETVQDFRSELRISPLPAIVLLFVIAIVTFTVSGIPTTLEDRFRVMILTAVLLLF